MPRDPGSPGLVPYLETLLPIVKMNANLAARVGNLDASF